MPPRPVSFLHLRGAYLGRPAGGPFGCSVALVATSRAHRLDGVGPAFTVLRVRGLSRRSLAWWQGDRTVARDRHDRGVAEAVPARMWRRRGSGIERPRIAITARPWLVGTWRRIRLRLTEALVCDHRKRIAS